MGGCAPFAPPLGRASCSEMPRPQTRALRWITPWCTPGRNESASSQRQRKTHQPRKSAPRWASLRTSRMVMPSGCTAPCTHCCLVLQCLTLPLPVLTSTPLHDPESTPKGEYPSDPAEGVVASFLASLAAISGASSPCIHIECGIGWRCPPFPTPMALAPEGSLLLFFAFTFHPACLAHPFYLPR